MQETGKQLLKEMLTTFKSTEANEEIFVNIETFKILFEKCTPEMKKELVTEELVLEFFEKAASPAVSYRDNRMAMFDLVLENCPESINEALFEKVFESGNLQLTKLVLKKCSKPIQQISQQVLEKCYNKVISLKLDEQYTLNFFSKTPHELFGVLDVFLKNCSEEVLNNFFDSSIISDKKGFKALFKTNNMAVLKVIMRNTPVSKVNSLVQSEISHKKLFEKSIELKDFRFAKNLLKIAPENSLFNVISTALTNLSNDKESYDYNLRQLLAIVPEMNLQNFYKKENWESYQSKIKTDELNFHQILESAPKELQDQFFLKVDPKNPPKNVAELAVIIFSIPNDRGDLFDGFLLTALTGRDSLNIIRNLSRKSPEQLQQAIEKHKAEIPAFFKSNISSPLTDLGKYPEASYSSFDVAKPSDFGAPIDPLKHTHFKKSFEVLKSLGNITLMNRLLEHCSEEIKSAIYKENKDSIQKLVQASINCEEHNSLDTLLGLYSEEDLISFFKGNGKDALTKHLGPQGDNNVLNVLLKYCPEALKNEALISWY